MKKLNIYIILKIKNVILGNNSRNGNKNISISNKINNKMDNKTSNIKIHD